MPKVQSDAEWFRDKIAEVFGEAGQTSLARFLMACGDTRDIGTIRRSIQNYVSGRSPLLPEMRALMLVLSIRGTQALEERLTEAIWPNG